MKKTIAVLLSLAMMLGFATMALATGADSTSPPDKSTYEFRFAVPDNIMPGEDVLLPVTFKTVYLGKEGYDNVRFEVVNTVAPASGSVTFRAKDREIVRFPSPITGFTSPPPVSRSRPSTCNY